MAVVLDLFSYLQCTPMYVYSEICAIVFEGPYSQETVQNCCLILLRSANNNIFTSSLQ